MSKETAITVIEQREVEFYGDEILAIQADNGIIYVPVRPLCALIGVDWSSQYRRINRDLVLSQVVMSVAVTATDIDPTSKRPRTNEMLCLPLEYLNGWLFGINANRVKGEIKDKLVQYQLECYRVLADAFSQPLTPSSRTSETSLLQIREMGLAIARMAEEQLEHERRLAEHDKRLNAAAQYVLSMDKRLKTIEQRVSPGNPISEEQAAEVAQQVKALASTLSQDDSATNHYQAIWGELYRRFHVNSYKLIPQAKFGAVLRFLEEWGEQIA